MIEVGHELAAAVSVAEQNARLTQAQYGEWQLARKTLDRPLDSAPEGVAVLDGATLRVLWANRAFYRHMGEPYPTAGGLRLHDFVPQAEESGLAEVFRRVAAAGQSCSDLEYEYNDFRSGPTYWRFSLRPFPHDGDGPTDLAVQVENITCEVMSRRQQGGGRRGRVKLRPCPSQPGTAPEERRTEPSTISVNVPAGSWRYR